MPQLGARQMTHSRKTCSPTNTGSKAAMSKEKQIKTRSQTNQFPTMGIFTTTVYLASRDFNNSSTTEAGWSTKYLSFFSSGFNRPKFCSQKEKALVGTLRGEDPCRIPLVMSTCEQKCLVMLTYSSNLLLCYLSRLHSSLLICACFPQIEAAYP